VRKFKKTILISGDILLLYAGLFFAFWSRKAEIPSYELWLKAVIPFGMIFLVWMIVFYSQKFYDLAFIKRGISYYENLFKALFFNVFLGFSYFYILPYLPYLDATIAPKTILVLTAVNGTFLIHIWRRIFSSLVLRGVKTEKVAIFGDDEKTIALLKKLGGMKHPDFEIKQITTDAQRLKHILEEENIETVILDEKIRKKNLIKAFPQSLLNKTGICSASAFYENQTLKVPFDIKPSAEMLEDISRKENPFYKLSKRVFDVFLALLIGLLFLPLVPFIVIFIKAEDRGPIFYTQKRIGKNGERFKLYKFRTMTPDPIHNPDAQSGRTSWTKGQDKRVTKIGKFLRITHLDEYAQIINIFKGEMSFVGPRPERPQFVDTLKKESPFYNLRHLVKPGLTGWAQIHYLYGDSVKKNFEKLTYDLYYVKNRSFLFDLAIILKTASIVLGTRGR